MVHWEYLDSDKPFGFAHRGGNRVAPENTLAAFQHAWDTGLRYLETDVHVTTDGVLVAFHDNGLERTTGQPGKISDHSWAEIKDLLIDGKHAIPTLHELLEAFPDARFNIDPKEDSAVAPLAETIKAHNAVHRVCIGAFSDRRIATLRRQFGPSLCTSAGPRNALRIYLSAYLPTPTTTLGHGCLQIPTGAGPWSVSAGFVERVHAAGLQVHVWTVNDGAEMERLFDMGVDAVMSDDVELLASVIFQR